MANFYSEAYQPSYFALKFHYSFLSLANKQESTWNTRLININLFQKPQLWKRRLSEFLLCFQWVQSSLMKLYKRILYFAIKLLYTILTVFRTGQYFAVKVMEKSLYLQQNTQEKNPYYDRKSFILSKDFFLNILSIGKLLDVLKQLWKKNIAPCLKYWNMQSCLKTTAMILNIFPMVTD